MKVYCAHDKMVPISELIPHPKNPNKHKEDQITRLSQIMDYQGWRNPIKVSRLSGFITAGHGRLMAARKLGLTEVPVNYQEYESEEQEYADLVSDNMIASWSKTDLKLVNLEIENLGPDLDIDLLGIKGFTVEPLDSIDPNSVVEDLLKDEYLVVLELNNEREQADIFDEMKQRGVKCKLMS